MNNYPSMMHIVSTFFILLGVVLFSSCSTANKSDVYRDKYDVLIADSFSVTLDDLSGGKKNTIFSLSNKSDYIITSASIDQNNSIIAISLTKNNASPDGAQIVFVNKLFPYNVVKKIQTDFNRIWGLSYSKNGDLAFVAGKMKIDDPNDLCVIRNLSKEIKIVSSGRHFLHLSWDHTSKIIYFASIVDGKRAIGSVFVDSPGVINEITKGVSVCASGKNENVFMLDQDANIHSIVNGIVGKKINVSGKHLDSRFTDSISFVRFGDDLIVQEYIKATTYKLLVIPPPYDKIFPFLSAQPMQSFEVVNKNK